MKKILLTVLGMLLGTFAFNGTIAQECYEMVWGDEFDYTGLPDPEKWNYDVGGHGWGNDELQYYTRDLAKNARVDSGKLIIEAHKETYMGKNYTSARLISKGLGDWLYGKVEVRAKLPAGRGSWPAIWMLPTDWSYGGWPKSGEIDIMEHVGYDPGAVHASIHTESYNHAIHTQKTSTVNVNTFNTEFHTYALEWTPDTIKISVDNHTYFKFGKHGTYKEWPFDKRFHLLMNIAVGGFWGGLEGIDDSIFPIRMEVDYVHVYQYNDGKPKLYGDKRVLRGEKNIRYSTVHSDSFKYVWTVPDDALIASGQGTGTIFVDWGCDTGRVSCKLTTLCGEYDLNLKVGIDTLSITGEDLIMQNQKGIEYSVPSTREALHIWTFPDGVKNTAGDDTNSVKLDWGSNGGLIKIKVNNICGSDSSTKYVAIIAQTPFPDPETPNMIPGKIYSTHYDAGGLGISYHDTEIENLGTGMRQDEGVDTEMNDGYYTVGWTEAGEWMEYTVSVEKTASYNLDVRLASINTTGKFRILFNGIDKTGEIAAPNTGAWNTFVTKTLTGIRLSTDDTIMRIEIVEKGFNLGNLVFSEATTFTRTMPFDNNIAIQTLVGDFIYIKNGLENQSYSVHDIAGRTLKKGTVGPDGGIMLKGLSRGVYILTLSTPANQYITTKFYKVE